MFRIIAFLMLLSQAAAAQSAMSGDEFDAYTLGKTLTFMENGQAYGVEQYLPGRRVTWAFDNGDCKTGRWNEPETGMICFSYEGSDEGAQCWNFFRIETGLRAKFLGVTDGRELYEARRSLSPMLCLGPQVGV
ncbi:MAG: hypothetical protein V3U96_05440 [Paracoccaceae bacterium]